MARRPVRPARSGAPAARGAVSPTTGHSPSTPTLGGSPATGGPTPASPASRWQLHLRPPGHGVAPHENPRTPQKVPEVHASTPDITDDTPPKGSKPNTQRRQPCYSENGGHSMLGRGVGAHRNKLPPRKGDSPVTRSPACKANREPLQDLTNFTNLRRNHSDVLHRPQKSATSASLEPQPRPASAQPEKPAAATPPPVAATSPTARPPLPLPVREPQLASTSPSAYEPVPTDCLPAPEPLLQDFSVAGPRYGAAAVGRISEDMPISVRHALNFIKLLPSLPCTDLGSIAMPLLPPRSGEDAYRPTLVLDLDETLVHCSREGKGRPRCQADQPPDLVIEFEVTPAYGNVYFRPFVHLFLEVAARSFEIVVFTASQQAYADKVINALDPEGVYIKHRLYRQHCTEVRGAFFKELGPLGRPLGQCLLVDNSPISVACNADHGILIQSWYGDRNDRELVDLLAVLQDLQLHGGEVDRYLASRYGLREFFEAMRQGVA